MSLFEMNSIELIRKRPAMYVGSMGIAGRLHFLVSAMSLHLDGRPSYIVVSKDGDSYTIESDGELKIIKSADGAVLPFGRIQLDQATHVYQSDGPIVAALSQSLSVEAESRHGRWSIQYRGGSRESLRVEASGRQGSRLTLRLAPDPTFFTTEDGSPYSVHSYLKRFSYLHPGIRVSFCVDGQKEEFYSAKGIVDFYEQVAGPYQLLHQPIHFRVSQDDLDLELIFAFHSWRDNWNWSFINGGRAVLGGIHEQGLAVGLRTFRSKFSRSIRKSRIQNGMIAMMSVRYLHAFWIGAIRGQIGDQEIVRRIGRLVFSRSVQWIEEHPEVARQISAIQTFQFPDIWGR